MKRDTLCAAAGATLVWLLALPTTAADESYAGHSYGDKSLAAVFSIFRVEARAEPHDSNRTVFIQAGMRDGGFPNSTLNPKTTQWGNYGIKMFHAFFYNEAQPGVYNTVSARPPF